MAEIHYSDSEPILPHEELIDDDDVEVIKVNGLDDNGDDTISQSQLVPVVIVRNEEDDVVKNGGNSARKGGDVDDVVGKTGIDDQLESSIEVVYDDFDGSDDGDNSNPIHSEISGDRNGEQRIPDDIPDGRSIPGDERYRPNDELISTADVDDGKNNAQRKLSKLAWTCPYFLG